MMGKFMENMGIDPSTACEFAKEFKKGCKEWNFADGPRKGGCHGGEKPWKMKRAQILQMPKEVLHVFPGQLLMIQVEVRNGT